MNNMKKLLCLVIVLTSCFMSTALAQVVETPRDGFYDKTNYKDKEPIPYPYVSEANVLWQKRIWRTIDLREKNNQVFYYPEVPQLDWKNLMSVITDGISNGDITAYDASTDQFISPLSYDEVQEKLSGSSDTLHIQRSTPPYDWYDTIINKDFNSQDIKAFRIKEDWFFDKKRSVMECRIIGICPVKENYDSQTGELRGTIPLFWIYYPQARKVFAKSCVFNPKNDAVRLSYEDVFTRRMFSSTIYKESNTYDRYISDYSTGLDALIEADRIQDEIRQFESNMWQH